MVSFLRFLWQLPKTLAALQHELEQTRKLLAMVLEEQRMFHGAKRTMPRPADEAAGSIRSGALPPGLPVPVAMPFRQRTARDVSNLRHESALRRQSPPLAATRDESEPKT